MFVGQTFQQGILLLHLMLDDNGNPVDLMVEVAAVNFILLL